MMENKKSKKNYQVHFFVIKMSYTEHKDKNSMH